ncbi:protein-disulfide reductase DsbD [Sulfurovum sp. bin170]|uniref:protein-disulfide reductase DsbD n=1 Tax=Sulfurovum sp. bin170 TaxID=2695268 RepID=UPI0013E04C1F|nr:protein-disulfide reductase DsbD [Sulfurovum sp. bin170]NEW60782.1 protein-disulfide reductase DsbD [Sulfurovum sp. bin170]
MRILKLFLLVTLFLSADFSSALKAKSKFLSPDEAFKVSAVENGDMIETKIILADKIHVADESLKYRIIKPKEFELTVNRPTPHKTEDGMVHEGNIVVNIPIADITSHVSGDYTLVVELQGCSDKGICYNTIEKEYNFKAPQGSVWDKLKKAISEKNTHAIVDILLHESPIFIIFLFLILGLLLALTPCIFPMIPILSSIIVSQSGSGKPNAMKGFLTSLIYVLSMAVTYTIVGVLSGILGADIQAIMQSPLVLTIFALMFFALAISLFGYFEIQLPSSWQSKINSASDNAQGHGVVGTAIMGFLSAFIIGPCVAPPLAGAVIFISQTGDALLGGTALFAMSMGMGVPLLLVGAGAGKFMPRPGGWMTRVSQVFGVTMLALSISMFSGVLGETTIMLLWSLLFIGLALYMGAFNSSKESQGASKLFQLMAFVSLIYGASLFIGLLSGSTSMMHPFEKFTATPKIVASSVLNTTDAPSSSKPWGSNKVDKKSHLGYSVERLLEEVKQSDLPVVVDFGKKSCKSCRELEALTFPDPAVVKELERFTFITIDITEQTDDDKALLKEYSLFGAPNIIFFDKENKFLPKKSLTGFIGAEPFTKHLKTIK